MSAETIRVVLIHDPYHIPDNWEMLLTELCGGVHPSLLPSDKASPDVLRTLNPHRIVAVTPIAPEIYTELMESIPILAAEPALESFMQAFGGGCEAVEAVNDHYLMHDGVGLWTGFTEPIEVQGYPATAPDQSELPVKLVVTAWNDERVAMALSHRMLPLVALNFHPNDIGENLGGELVIAFLEGKYLGDNPTGPPEV